VAARANEELAELLEKLCEGEFNPAAPVEVADVVIVLARLATRLGVDATEAAVHHTKGDWPILVTSRANKAMSNLLRALTMDDASQKAGEILLTLLGQLRGVCVPLGCDLGEEIDKKMMINRSREWKLDGSGHGYHVRKGSEREANPL
jgi:hypothetical protein